MNWLSCWELSSLLIVLGMYLITSESAHMRA
jgi:hypothetical protein